MVRLGFDRLLSMSPLGSSQPPIAVDFGVRSVKLLQLSSHEQPTIVAAACRAVPDELMGDSVTRLAFQCQQLPALLKSAPFRGKRVVCSLPASQIFCKHLQLALPEGASVTSLVAATVAGQLNCDPSSLVCRQVIVEGAVASNGKSEVIGIAAAKSLVRKLMDALKAAKLEPVGIHPEPLALLRSFDHITRRANDGEVTSLYLDLGAGATKVSIAHGQNLVFAKTIQLGGNYLDQMVAQQSKCTPQQANAIRLAMRTLTRGPAPAATPTANPDNGDGMALLRAAERLATREAGGGSVPGEPEPAATALADDRRSGTAPKGFATIPDAPPSRAGAVDLKESLDALTDEISLCLRYHETLFPNRRVSRTIFVGGEARHVGLCQHIARSLRLPAHVADPFARLGRAESLKPDGVDLSQPQPGWSVAVGLCQSPTDL